MVLVQPGVHTFDHVQPAAKSTKHSRAIVLGEDLPCAGTGMLKSSRGTSQAPHLHQQSHLQPPNTPECPAQVPRVCWSSGDESSCNLTFLFFLSWLFKSNRWAFTSADVSFNVQQSAKSPVSAMSELWYLLPLVDLTFISPKTQWVLQQTQVCPGCPPRLPHHSLTLKHYYYFCYRIPSLWSSYTD